MRSATVDRIDVFPVSHALAPGREYGSARFHAHARSATIVRVTTSEGVQGWGESFGPPAAAATLTRALGATFVGQPVDRIAPATTKLLDGHYHLSAAGLHPSALSGIDMALWDAWGRTLDVSISRLLGGRMRDAVRAYASTAYSTPGDDIGRFRDSVESAVAEGYDAVKVKLGFGPREDEHRARVAREAIGDERALMVDYNGNYTADLAAQSLERLAPLDIYWAEEPVPVGDVGAWRHLRNHSTITLASGESLATRFGFRQLASEQLVDFLQPDLTICGGFTEGRVIMDMASTWGLRASPHVWGTAIGDAAALQMLAATIDAPQGRTVPEAPWLERDRSENPLRDELLTQPLAIAEGVATIPDGPGLGVEVDEDVIDRYLVKED